VKERYFYKKQYAVFWIEHQVFSFGNYHKWSQAFSSWNCKIFSKWKLKYLCDTKHNYDSFSDCNILPEINPLRKEVILHIHIYLNVRSEELNCLVIKVFDLNLDVFGMIYFHKHEMTFKIWCNTLTHYLQHTRFFIQSN